jgi:rubrerythrin
MFIVMVIIGMLFNPMNILAYRFSDLYISQTLFYGGLLMASNMMWAHEIVHYLSMGHFNMLVFSVGIVLSISVAILLLRQQVLVDDKQWLRRMISHHSTALTTSHKIYNKTSNPKVKKLSKEIIDTQEKEIQLMKSML